MTTSQVLEFYPSEQWCIQWCHHCLRGIKKPSWNIVHEVSNRHRELARNILFAFTEENDALNALNLSWYIWDYSFQLFDDIWWMDLNQVYFNLWTVSSATQKSIDDDVRRVNHILRQNTWSKDIDIFWNIQYVSGGEFLKQAQEIEKFVRWFFSAVQWGVSFSDSDFTGLMIASNNITERNFRQLNPQSILNAFIDAHYCLGESEISSVKFQDFTKQWVLFVRSDRVISGKQSRIDFRGIQAKKSWKTTFLDELKTSLWNNELTLSIFPDTIMIYHSTLNMDISELFFDYNEFEWLLRDFVYQTGSERKTLKQIIDERLLERADNLWLLDM